MRDLTSAFAQVSQTPQPVIADESQPVVADVGMIASGIEGMDLEARLASTEPDPRMRRISNTFFHTDFEEAPPPLSTENSLGGLEVESSSGSEDVSLLCSAKRVAVLLFRLFAIPDRPRVSGSRRSIGTETRTDQKCCCRWMPSRPSARECEWRLASGIGGWAA